MMKTKFAALLISLLATTLLAFSACKSTNGDNGSETEATAEPTTKEGASAVPDGEPEASAESQPKKTKEGTEKLPDEPPEGLAQATLAGGCFWCMEPPFDRLDGVKETISGYTGGDEKHPTYKEVSYGRTGHTEAVRIYYDPSKVDYEKLLDVFWRNHDPTDADGQFVDRGSQYRPAVFYHGEEQKKLATKSKKELAESGRFDEPIATKLQPAGAFWRAEEYHQNFYEKSPRRYKSYRKGSGRDQFIERVWGD